MKLIGKIIKDNTNLSKLQFFILQALIISKYEYERIYKDFIDNHLALVVDDSLKEVKIKSLIVELHLEEEVLNNEFTVDELNYKLNTDFFLFYFFSIEEILKNFDNLDGNKLENFFDLIKLLRIDIGYMTNELIKSKMIK